MKIKDIIKKGNIYQKPESMLHVLKTITLLETHNKLFIIKTTTVSEYNRLFRIYSCTRIDYIVALRK